MRWRAALVLLCFGWHLAVPLAVRALERQVRRGDELAARHAEEPSSWVPRTVGARLLLYVSPSPEARSSTRAARVLREPRLVGALLRTRHDAQRRTTYPARRRLRRLARAAGDPPPA